MRNRTKFIPGEPSRVVVTRTRKSNGNSHTLNGTLTAAHRQVESAMIDSVNDPLSAQSKERVRRQIAIAHKIADLNVRSSVLADLYSATMQAHPCDHTITRIKPSSDIIVKSVDPTYYNTHTYTGAAALHEAYGTTGSAPETLINVLKSTGSVNGEGGAFLYPDWYALLTKWHDACNSIVPSSSLLGESMVENAIFVDAFKTLLNPSRVLKIFLERARAVAKRGSTLGKVSGILRNASDAHLSYNFGIRPAISQIRDVLAAHRKVSNRLTFLRMNAGNYIPVQVRSFAPSSNSDYTYTGTSTVKILREKGLLSCISALAKVRPDLDFRQDWRAYWEYFGLNKVISLGWELIPFSFVLDWFTNAGDYVARHTTPSLDSPFYNIRNLCHSTKEFRKYDFEWSKNKTFSSLGATIVSEANVVIGSLEISRYIRATGLPETSGAISFSHLGLFHGVTSGALLLQRFLR